MNISELKPNQKDIDLEGVKIVELSPVKEFTKFGETGRVCNALIKDSSGEISLTLWNDQIDQVKVGGMINVKSAMVKEWQGYLQLNTGRNGSLEVLKN